MKLVLCVVALSLVLASSLPAQHTVQVKAGWNIIGSVKAGAVPDVLTSIPDSLINSSYWGYTPGVGYESTDTLDNGLGYWVKAKADGLIVFKNTPESISAMTEIVGWKVTWTTERRVVLTKDD